MPSTSPVLAAGPVPTDRSFVISFFGGSQLSGMVMVGFSPNFPVVLMSSAVHSLPLLCVGRAVVVGLAGDLAEVEGELEEAASCFCPQLASVRAAATTAMILAAVCMPGDY